MSQLWGGNLSYCTCPWNNDSPRWFVRPFVLFYCSSIIVPDVETLRESFKAKACQILSSLGMPYTIHTSLRTKRIRCSCIMFIFFRIVEGCARLPCSCSTSKILGQSASTDSTPLCHGLTSTNQDSISLQNSIRAKNRYSAYTAINHNSVTLEIPFNYAQSS